MALENKRFVNIRELAALFNVSERTIYDWRKRGRLPKPVKKWGSPRWDMDEVERHMRKMMERE